jgi:hypothetical protein
MSHHKSGPVKVKKKTLFCQVLEYVMTAHLSKRTKYLCAQVSIQHNFIAEADKSLPVSHYS